MNKTKGKCKHSKNNVCEEQEEICTGYDDCEDYEEEE